MWSLLPKFCVDPVDLCTALTPDFARVLGMTLKEAGIQFRKIVCQALKQLISSCRRQGNPCMTCCHGNPLPKCVCCVAMVMCCHVTFYQMCIFSCQPTDQDLTRLSRFAKNFLPILFSLYAPPPSGEATPLHTDSGKKGFLMECIKMYLSIAGE